MTRTEYNALVAQVRHLDTLYRQGRPLVTDAAFDEMVARLRRTETLHPQWSAEDSPTRTVGDDRTGARAKIYHAVPMLSLTSYRHMDEVADWWTGAGKPAVMVEPKIDGVALCLSYEHGVLVSASTRGDGHEGEDVTAQVRHAAGIPARLVHWHTGALLDVTGDIRGELYISPADFAELPAYCGKGEYKSARDAVAACINYADTDFCQDFPMRFVAYSCTGMEEVIEKFEQLHMMVTCSGGHAVGPVFYCGKSRTGLLEVLRTVNAWRHTDGYPTDGVVVKCEDSGVRAALGEGSRAPHWAVAYKPVDVQVMVTVDEVNTVGKSRVAHFTPVIVHGREVGHISVTGKRHWFAVGDRLVLSFAEGASTPDIVGKINGEGGVA